MRLGTVTRWLVPALLLAVAGCGSAPASTMAHPSVRIVAPVNTAKEIAPVGGSASVTVRVSVSHFTILPGGSKTAGSGQLWLYENGKLLTRKATTALPLALQPGTYTLKAVLVTNGKPVAASAPVVLSVSTPISCAHTPQPSSGLKAGTVTLFCQGLPAGGAVLGLLAGPGGDLWFPVKDFTNANSVRFGIGRITPSGVITVFNLPSVGFLGNLVAGPGGDLWFITTNNGIGRITPSGAITVFSHGLPAGGLPGGNLVTGPGSDLWFRTYNGIGRITPSGTITVFSHGLPAGGLPGGNLVTGPDGNLWFPVYPPATSAGGNGAIGIGRITPSGVITVFSHGLPAGSLAGGNSNAAQWGAGQLLAGPGGDLWFTVQSAYATSAKGTDAIGRITASGTITVFHQGLPAGNFAGKLVTGPGGDLWFAMSGTSGLIGIGRITPSGAIAMFSHGLPSVGFIGNLVAGPGGDLWFTTNNGIGRITPSGSITVFSHGLPAGGGGPGNLVTGPDGNLWFLVPGAGTFCCFGLTTTDAIGRIVP